MAFLHARQECPTGYSFYSCANGWRGCCFVDPCNPGDTCAKEDQVPLTQTNTRATTTKAAATSKAVTTTSETAPPTTSPSSTSTTVTTVSEQSQTTAEASTDTSSTTLSQSTSTSEAATQSSDPPPPNATQSGSGAEPGAAKPGPNKGIIAGATVAGVIGIVVIAILMSLLLIKRRKRANAMHQATLERRASMRPMEMDNQQSTFAPFGGFYRGVKTVHQPIETNCSEISEPDFTDSPTTDHRSYRVVNGDASPISSPRSPTYLSSIPSINLEPVQISSKEIVAPVEMPDTSPVSNASSSPNKPRTLMPTSSPTLGILPQTVYRPYRPASESASLVSPVVSQASDQTSQVGAGALRNSDLPDRLWGRASGQSISQ